MDDPYERRALLLHLGDVLQVIDSVLSAGEAVRTIGELGPDAGSAHGALLAHLAPEMRANDFVRRATRAFRLWPVALLELEIDRDALAGSVQQHLFETDAAGWRAYCAQLQPQVPWFGAGTLAASALDAGERERSRPVPEARSEAAAASADKSHGSLYPAWPWKPGG